MNPEFIGIPAATLVLLSYFFKTQVKLRWVNILASAVFVAYGLAIAATTQWTTGWSTVILNALAIVVHVVWLVKYYKGKNKDE